MEEVIEADLKQGGLRGVGGDVSADAGVLLVLPVHHRHGVPAEQGFNALLQLAVAGVGNLFIDGDGVAVGSGELAGVGDAQRAGAVAQCGQKLGTLLAAFSGNIVKGFKPLGNLFYGIV